MNFLEQAREVYYDEVLVSGNSGGDYSVIFVDLFTNSEIDELIGHIYNSLLVVFLVSIATSFILSYFIALTRVKKQVLDKELELFRRMLDKTKDGIFIVDGESGKIVTVNKRVIDNLGYVIEELNQMTPDNINKKIKNLDEWRGIVRKVKKEKTIQIEGVFRRKDGSEFPVEINLGISDVGNKEYVVQVVRDITKRKEAEKRILELNEVLRILNKILRHDILNDITVVSSNIDLLPEKIKTLDEMVDASTALERSKELIEKMRETEQAVTSGDTLERVDIAKEIKRIAGEFDDMKITVEGSGYVLADKAFGSVAGNFFRNTKMHGETSNVKVTIAEIGNRVELRFADDGKGIPDDIKSKLFVDGGKFGETGNTGLGLYIIKKTIERYGGSVRVEDNKPKGVAFVIDLPKA